MDYCTPQPTRRHNPVDSICRKLQTIQWRGDREPNSPFQIPKLSSSSYDSPQCGLRHNLEAILKKGALRKDKDNQEKENTRGMGMPSSAASQKSNMGPSSTPLSTPCTPGYNLSTPANITYTITSTLGDRRGADGSDLKQVKSWQRYCSTPSGNSSDSPYFTFTRGPQSEKPENERPSRSPPLSRTFTPGHSTLSYNLNFSSVDNGNSTKCELPYPALVVKRLSMCDGGTSLTSENRRGNMAEISLICEENLLDTIFHACDTQRRGKVYVSHIVDYLRHTTSRDSEDRGLEELCNMLDPEHKDVSIDLDTYHAVMREWIDDCRNNEYHCQYAFFFFSAFGGEASRAEFETSELVYCVADLQMSNQKLQEEVRKLKQVVESMEDSNQRLAEENEELQNQTRVNQQLAQKEKMLKDEVEEMKAMLSCTEDNRARASAHSKHVERENQTLIAKIASLQEENFKVTMEMDELQRRIAELCDINADLQKNRQINEMKVTVEEYSSITEVYSNIFTSCLIFMPLLCPPVCCSAGLSLSVAYRLNQSSSGSLQTELALAQSPLETPHGVDHLSTTMSFASPLDETLDREVLLMLQGPSPEHMALEFKNILNKMVIKSKYLLKFLFTVRGLLDDPTQPGGNTDTRLQTVQSELDARRADWALSLDQLAQYTDSLEKELIKMASNMRRSRTEILHLSVRVQEQENQKRQLCEELEQLRTPQDSREASCQTPTPDEEVRYSRVATVSESSSPLSATGLPFTQTSQSGSTAGSVTSDPSQLEDVTSAAKKDSLPLHGKNKKELVRPTSFSLCSEQTVGREAEFQRLALGFKCDMFTLEKRLRLEERSRDLAEENVRREVSSCQGLLQALTPLCEDDNQSMEIIQRLQKNLDILIQSMTRVSSRSEMLGAIHQESRIGKAVEVMIQHVENLRRMYTKEHAELLELRETLMQNERSFGSQTERGWLCCTSWLLLLCPYVIMVVFRNVAGKNMARPPLKRFVSSAAWVDTEEPSLMMKGGSNASSPPAGLLALLASLVMQPAVDAAPVGTGDSWMTIQQLLWPYTGLRHNGQPPV
uniref:Lymphoid-restricted membrane protein n=1 Tax=Sphaeramia orbicularis TaxID=375764 RepID=A0A673BE41_9TELE